MPPPQMMTRLLIATSYSSPFGWGGWLGAGSGSGPSPPNCNAHRVNRGHAVCVQDVVTSGVAVKLRGFVAFLAAMIGLPLGAALAQPSSIGSEAAGPPPKDWTFVLGAIS